MTMSQGGSLEHASKQRLNANDDTRAAIPPNDLERHPICKVLRLIRAGQKFGVTRVSSVILYNMNIPTDDKCEHHRKQSAGHKAEAATNGEPT